MIHSGTGTAGWRYGLAYDGAVHVEPVNDLVGHEVQDCVCGPLVEPVKQHDGGTGWLVTHHPLDGRDRDEQRKEASMVGKQSDERVPQRSGEPQVRRGSGPPSSFGRPVQVEPVQAPVDVPAQIGGLPFRVVNGRLVLEVDVQLVVGQESAQAFYDEVRQLTVLAMSDGLSTVLGRKAGDDAGGETGGKS